MAYYELNEQELGRRESLGKLRELGIRASTPTPHRNTR